MSAYQTEARLVYTPTKEVIFGANGALLSQGTPRYDTLQEYVLQFAAPTSQLRGEYTFVDPMHPYTFINVRCVAEPLCDQCGETLDACECAF